MDAEGHHLVCCTLNGKTRRHGVVQDALLGVAQKAGFTSRKEKSAPDGSRPGDIFIPRYDADGPAAIDITIRDPIAPSRGTSPITIDGWHQRQERTKIDKYALPCKRLGWKFIPFVMDVFGGFAEQSAAVMNTFIKAQAGQVEGWQRRAQEASIWQQISLALMKEIGKQLVWIHYSANEPSLNEPRVSHDPYH